MSVLLLVGLIMYSVRPITHEPFRSLGESIVVCGTVYNCEPYLDAVFRNIERIAGAFQQCSVIMAIDRGTDRSLEKLEKHQHALKSKGIAVQILQGERTGSSRTENLANARNRIIAALRALQRTNPFAHFILMDCDDVCSRPIHLDALTEVFHRAQEWDAVSFLGRTDDLPEHEQYYDYWALSIRPHLISCFHFSEPYTIIAQKKKQIHALVRKGAWIPCYSAFNGFAVYRASFLRFDYNHQFDAITALIPEPLKQESIEAARAANVEYTPGAMTWDCEHRFFHFTAAFRHQARMFIVPQTLFK